MTPDPPGLWAVHAACKHRTDDMTVPDRIGPAAIRLAIAHAVTICNGCAVRQPCREWALTEPDPAVGLVAGGLSPRARDQVRRWGAT